jgi:DNA processing protein
MLHPYTYLVALHSLGITHREFRNAFLEDHTQTDTPDYQNLYDTIYTAGSIFFDEKKTEKRKEKQAKIDIQKISTLLTQKDIHIVLHIDPVYPDSLRQISHAPYFLYVRGTLVHTPYSIGVVGSRKSTQYAERVLRYILPELVQHGFAIVSGGAYGVDTLAHTLALEYSGYTIAVMGTGIDRAYPAANVALFQKIIDSGGALISHFPLGT